jgi:hypothetical protein
MMFSLALEMSSELRGKLGALPLPAGERVGVRGLRSIERPLSPAGRGGTPRLARILFLEAQGCLRARKRDHATNPA